MHMMSLQLARDMVTSIHSSTMFWENVMFGSHSHLSLALIAVYARKSGELKHDDDSERWAQWITISTRPVYINMRQNCTALLALNFVAFVVLIFWEHSLIFRHLAVMDANMISPHRVAQEQVPPSLNTTTNCMHVSTGHSKVENAFPRIFTSSNNLIIENPQPIDKVYLLGERNSGTKFIGKLLHKAFGDHYAAGTGNKHVTGYETEIPILNFKHIFRHSELNSTETKTLQHMNQSLWLLVVRNPCDWADAMYRVPWHLCPPYKSLEWCLNQPKLGLKKEQREGVTRAQFFQNRWNDWMELKLQRENHEMYNHSYPSVFALRNHKLRIMFQIMKMQPHNVKVIHLKEVSRSSNSLISELVTDFGLKLRSDFDLRVQEGTIIKTSICLQKNEWTIARNQIDWELEAQFGFSQLDCHMCIDRQASSSINKTRGTHI